MGPIQSQPTSFAQVAGAMALLVIALVLTWFLVDATALRIVLSLVLVTALGGCVGWLVNSLRKDSKVVSEHKL